MEDKDLQKIWMNIDLKSNLRSTEELNLLLKSKTRQTMNKLMWVTGISVVVSAGLLVFLIITSLNRKDDLLYLINNITLGVITISSLCISVLSWYKMQNNKYNQALKDWLETRINLLSRWLSRKSSTLYVILIPFLYALTVLSIHVYFENKLLIDVLKTEESIVGLIVGIPIGLFVSFYSIRKIRKFQLQNLEFLKDLYKRLCKI